MRSRQERLPEGLKCSFSGRRSTLTGTSHGRIGVTNGLTRSMTTASRAADSKIENQTEGDQLAWNEQPLSAPASVPIQWRELSCALWGENNTKSIARVTVLPGTPIYLLVSKVDWVDWQTKSLQFCKCLSQLISKK